MSQYRTKLNHPVNGIFLSVIELCFVRVFDLIITSVLICHHQGETNCFRHSGCRTDLSVYVYRSILSLIRVKVKISVTVGYN